MATVDYLIVGFIAISAFVGLVRGFVREALSLAIWIAAGAFAFTFADAVAAALPPRVEGASLRYACGLAIVFVATLVAGGIVQWLIGRLVRSTGLSGSDRLVGVLFGVLRGAVVCIVAVIAMRPFAAEQSWWKASRAIPLLSAFEPHVLHGIDATEDVVERIRTKR